MSTASLGAIWGDSHLKRPLLALDEQFATPRNTSRRMSTKMSQGQLEERHRHEEEEEFNRQLNTFYFQMGSDEEEDPMACNQNEASASAEVVAEPVDTAQAWTIGGRAIHMTHRLGFTHGISHCWLCGAWCAGTPSRLVAPCRAPTNSGVDSIARMSRGGMPHNSMSTWPEVDDVPPLSVMYFKNPYGGPHRPKVKVRVTAAELPFHLLVRGRV